MATTKVSFVLKSFELPSGHRFTIGKSGLIENNVNRLKFGLFMAVAQGRNYWNCHATQVTLFLGTLTVIAGERESFDVQFTDAALRPISIKPNHGGVSLAYRGKGLALTGNMDSKDYNELLEFLRKNSYAKLWQKAVK